MSVSTAAASIAWLRHAGWGTALMREGQRLAWERLREWAGGVGPRMEARVQHMQSDLDKLRSLSRPDFGNDVRQQVRGKGGAIYRLAWVARYGQAFTDWLAARPTERRWLPTTGTEWSLVRSASSFTQTYHVFRLLSGGLRGPGGRRPRAVRATRPKKCMGCDGRDIAWSWITPGETHGGASWCRRCIPEGVWQQGMRGGALLPSERGSEHTSQGALGWPDSIDFGVTRDWPPCSLCGRGEATGEHLAVWCPAVAYAWGKWQPQALALLAVMKDPGEYASAAARILHQASFLCCSLRQSQMPGWRRAGDWLVRACTAYVTDVDAGVDDGPDPGDDEESGEALPGAVCTWDPEPETGCTSCASTVMVRCLRAGTRPETQRHSDRPGEANRLRPVTSTAVPAGRDLAVLYGESNACHWPLAARGWWPRPRASHAEANAQWDVVWRLQCRAWRTALRTFAPIPCGSEIVVDDDPCVLGAGGTYWQFEVSFDGGAKEIGGRRVAGGGVAVWYTCGGRGTAVLVARCVIAIPSQGHAQYAEAYACRVALRWITACRTPVRSVRVVGDNLAVMRFCAQYGRLRRPATQALLEQPLADLHAAGWRINWHAVRRRFNGAADALATEGVIWASALATAGANATKVRWQQEQDCGHAVHR